MFSKIWCRVYVQERARLLENDLVSRLQDSRQSFEKALGSMEMR